MATAKTTTRAPQSPAGAAQAAPAGGSTGAVAVRASQAVALPADLAAELAGAAKEAAAKERPSVSKLSLKGGVMSYMGNPMPNNKMDVVVIAYSYRNTFYEGAYDPNNIVNPTCFALSETGDEMAPHENVAEPVADACDTCPNNAWGSDPRGGRGKACKEGRRLVVVPADAIADPEVFAKSEMAVLDVPVTSVKNFGNYVNQLSAAVQRPMWAVVTTLEVVRDAKTQFKLTFEPVQAINDVAVIQAIKARLGDALRIAMIPYDESYLAGKEEPAPTSKAAPAKTAKFKGAK